MLQKWLNQIRLQQYWYAHRSNITLEFQYILQNSIAMAENYYLTNLFFQNIMSKVNPDMVN